MEQSDDSSQWEQSKENIQPLKQGRKATVLSAVLSDSANQKLNIIRHEFEEKLRTYSGKDPLEVWYEYILWVEQNYPKGGKEGKLKSLIEKCLLKMCSVADLMDKYANDQRLLDIWIKYANLYPYPLEIYQNMEAKGLCLSLAEFYISWAWEMEKVGNFKRAEAIYEKGLQVGAQPLTQLFESQKKFQIRVTRSTLEGRLDDQVVNSEQERVALGSLKLRQKVSVNRSGSALVGPAGRVHQDIVSRQTGGQLFSIMKDSSSKGAVTPVHMDENVKCALWVGYSSNKENIKKTCQWTKAKVHQKTKGIVPVEDIDKYQMPQFSVHEDEAASQNRASQVKPSHESNVLSVRNEYESWDVPLYIPEPFDIKVQPQYCKHKVYFGTEEFSFEELRAAQYTIKEREKRKKEDELQQMKEIIKKQEELIQRLQQGKTEDTRSHNSSKVNTLSESQPTSKRKEPKFGHAVFQDSWVSINKSATASNSVLHLLDESGSAKLKSEQLPIIGKGQESSITCNKSPAITAVPCTEERGSLSSSGNSRGLSFIDPTGDATNIMNELWSASLSQSTYQQVTDKGEISAGEASREGPAFTIHEDSTKNQHAGGSRVTPFEIFSDSVNENKKTETLGVLQPVRVLKEKTVEETGAAAAPKIETKETSTVGVAVMVSTADDKKFPEVQDENCPPPGMMQQPCQTRQISGILVPAKDIPIDESEGDQEITKSKHCTNWNANDVESLYISALKNDDLDDIVPHDGRQIEDFTIKMPNNLETFAHMAKVASTPVPWAKDFEPKSQSDIASSNNNFPLIQEDDANDSLKRDGNSDEVMPPPSTTRAHATSISSVTTSITSNYFNEPEGALSPIMEASREFRSSSSSSGCCTTPRGHSVHGVSQPANFTLSNTAHMSRIRHHSQPELECTAGPPTHVQPADFTKSGYLADRSRGESLADSLPYTSVSSHPQLKSTINSLAAEMILDFKDMVIPDGPDERKKTEFNVAKERNCDFLKNIDPFDEITLEQILSNLEVPLNRRGGYLAVPGNLSNLKAKLQVTLGRETFHINKVCGEGAYAKAYRAVTMDPLNVTLMPDDLEEDNKQQVILKVQKPACPWEFYICHELRQRLKASGCAQAILDSVMKVDRGYFFSDGSVLVNQYHQYGTLLDAINRYNAVGQIMPEEVAVYFMVELLSIMEAVHSCNIIHADIKPDNFLLQAIEFYDDTSYMFSSGPACLKLIDFGRSIDMKAFPEGTTFTKVVTTEKFTCCEMRDGRPWTYQTDYFGAAAIAHLFLFGTYMDVKKTDDGKWAIKNSLKRYWKKNIWEMIFSTLLNVPSCSSLLNLGDFRKELISAIIKEGMDKDIKVKFQSFSKRMKEV